MTRDEAVIAAQSERQRTGIPQVISMCPTGDWSCRPVTHWTPSSFAAERDVVAP